MNTLFSLKKRQKCNPLMFRRKFNFNKRNEPVSKSKNIIHNSTTADENVYYSAILYNIEHDFDNKALRIAAVLAIF
jgi:hypothetical protein